MVFLNDKFGPPPLAGKRPVNKIQHCIQRGKKPGSGGNFYILTENRAEHGIRGAGFRKFSCLVQPVIEKQKRAVVFVAYGGIENAQPGINPGPLLQRDRIPVCSFACERCFHLGQTVDNLVRGVGVSIQIIMRGTHNDNSFRGAEP